jgi:hypothetical protein
VLLRHVLVLVNERDLSERTKKIKEETVRLLCIICTVKTNRFYIPGETKMVERLRKEAFDKGIFTTLTYLYHHLHGDSMSDIRVCIKERCLNLIELNDLVYHVLVIEQLRDILKHNPQAFSETAIQSDAGT